MQVGAFLRHSAAKRHPRNVTSRVFKRGALPACAARLAWGLLLQEDASRWGLAKGRRGIKMVRAGFVLGFGSVALYMLWTLAASVGL